LKGVVVDMKDNNTREGNLITEAGLNLLETMMTEEGFVKFCEIL